MIRLTDASVGRDVAHALADGGVTALEVTMTVPRAVASDRRAGGDAAAGDRASSAPAPSLDARDGRRGDARRRAVRRRARCCGATSSRRAATRDVAVMPGCFSPTEILAAWDAGADIVKVFPATSLGPTFFKDMRGPLPHVKLMPTGGVTRAERRATGFAPARSRSASARRSSTPQPSRSADSTRSLRRRASTSSRAVADARSTPMRSAAMTPNVVCFGEIMLRLSPPGFERLLQSPVLQATFGGGEANVAVSLAHFGVAEPLRHARCRPMRLATPPSARCAAKACDVDHVQRGGSRLGIYFAETGASQRASTVHLRPRPLGDQRDRARIGRLGRRCCRARRGFTGRASRRRSAPNAAACVREAIDAARRAGARVSVDLNYRRKLWTEAQAQDVMRPLVTGADLADRQRRRPAVGARHRRRRRERDRPAQLDAARLPRGGRAGRARLSVSRVSPSRCARASRPATTAGARVLFDAASGDVPSQPALRRFAWSIASAAATALRRV